MTRDELIKELLSIRFDLGEAIHFAKHGVWSKGEKKEEYIKQLKDHNAKPELIEYFKNTNNLWPFCSCITRMQLICEKTWYEMNYKFI